jgi:hypothetical protein
MATPRQSVIDEANPGSSSCPIVRHEQTFPELASLGPAVAQGDTVLDEALPLLHLQALRSPQSSVDILPGARKTLAKYPCVVSGFCRGASSVQSYDERRIADQHDSAGAAKNAPERQLFFHRPAEEQDP